MLATDFFFLNKKTVKKKRSICIRIYSSNYEY